MHLLQNNYNVISINKFPIKREKHNFPNYVEHFSLAPKKNSRKWIRCELSACPTQNEDHLDEYCRCPTFSNVNITVYSVSRLLNLPILA